MKKITVFMFLFGVLAFSLYATGRVEETQNGDTSYAFGMIIGDELKQTGLTFNYNAFTMGVRDVLEDRRTNMTMEEAITFVQTALIDAMRKRAEESRKAEQEFLEQNAKREGVQVTPSGLQYEILVEGTGQKPGADDTVLVHYKGMLIDGTVFDSSYERNEPAEFPLNMVIEGWSEGLQLMSVGSNYRLYLPSELAYGEQGAGSTIPPFSVLIFEVELLSIVEK